MPSALLGGGVPTVGHPAESAKTSPHVGSSSIRCGDDNGSSIFFPEVGSSFEQALTVTHSVEPGPQDGSSDPTTTQRSTYQETLDDVKISLAQFCSFLPQLVEPPQFRGGAIIPFHGDRPIMGSATNAADKSMSQTHGGRSCGERLMPNGSQNPIAPQQGALWNSWNSGAAAPTCPKGRNTSFSHAARRRLSYSGVQMAASSSSSNNESAEIVSKAGGKAAYAKLISSLYES